MELLLAETGGLSSQGLWMAAFTHQDHTLFLNQRVGYESVSGLAPRLSLLELKNKQIGPKR